MKNALILAVFAIIGGFVSCGKPQFPVAGSKPTVPNKHNHLIFSDEFDGDKLDETKWNVETGTRHEAVNTNEAVRIEEGCLKIHPFTKNGIYYSAIVTTEDKFEFKGGYMEVRAAFGDVAGTFSDIWLWTETAGKDEPNFLKNGFEVYFLEHRKFDKNGKNISGYVNHTLHWNGYGKYHRFAATDTGDLHLGQGFHIYSLLWEEEDLSFYVDGKLTYLVRGMKTEKNLFILLSTEIGYINFWTLPPLKNINTNTLIVDYVRVYQ